MIVASKAEAEAALGLKHKCQFSADPTGPLVFLVHGRAGTVDVMWTFRRIIPENFHIISVQAPLADVLGGFSWWNVEQVNSKEGQEQAVPLLSQFMREAPFYYKLRPRQTFAFGFSQGAGMLSVIIQAPHCVLAGVALLAGFVIELPVQNSESAPRPKVFIAHGSKDEVVSIRRAYLGRDYLLSQGFEVSFVEDPVGHKVGSAGMRALKEWVRK